MGEEGATVNSLFSPRAMSFSVQTQSARRRPPETSVESLIFFTEILRCVARYYVQSTDSYVAQARDNVNRSVRGKECFHGHVLLALLKLSEKARRHRKGDLTGDLREQVGETLDVYNELVAQAYKRERTILLRSRGGLIRLKHEWGAYREHREQSVYRKYMSCPRPQLRRKFRAQIKSCTEAFDYQYRDDAIATGRSSILVDAGLVKEWKPPSSLSVHNNLLLKIMATYQKCMCSYGSDHEGSRVRLTYSHTRSEDILGTYKLCFVHANGHSPTSTLHLSEPNHKLQAGRLRFAGHDRTSGPTWESCLTFCNTSRPADESYVFRANEARLQYSISPTRPPNLSSEAGWRSLRHLLSSMDPPFKAVFNPVETVRLGVTLAYIYLYTGETIFWQVGTDEPDFWFNEVIRGSAHQNLVPFVQYRSEARSSATTPPLEESMNKQRPSLPALGKLLLEIWIGSVVHWEDVPARLDECRKNIGGEYWALAVETCVWGSEDAVLKEEGVLQKSPMMRAEFVRRVIKSMQWILENVCHQRVVDLFVATSEHPKQSSAEAPRQNEATLPDDLNISSVNNNTAENWGCLHDENDEWQPVDEKMKVATLVWQSELQTRTHALIDTITIPQIPKDPVRVAVIDTGASFGAKAARTYSRRIKDCRSWVGMQTRSCGEPQSYKDCDLDGHGTHAASVLLATDKHCEVYIAKAFRARKEKRDKHAADTHLAVANAIRYAVEVWKVDVISMSFGFDDVVDEIEDAFKVVAQHKGVLLAAASNCGNNHDTAWPARNRDVVCVYAADGYGNAYPRNPTPLLHDHCFSVLGIEVSGHWCHEGEAHRSGTSVATAVTAGIVCLIVRYMRSVKTTYLNHPDCDISAAQYDRLLERLTTGSGAIIQIFYLMSDQELRGGYHAIKPWKLLDAAAKKSAFLTVTEIRKAIDKTR